jgi:hypothetical protein
MDRPDDGHGARVCPRRGTGSVNRGSCHCAHFPPEAALDHAPVDVPKEGIVFADADTLVMPLGLPQPEVPAVVIDDLTEPREAAVVVDAPLSSFASTSPGAAVFRITAETIATVRSGGNKHEPDWG